MIPQSSSSPRVRIRIACVSIVGSAVILCLKWVAYWQTGSAALKSDALEGIVNVVAAFFALGALIYAEKPSDRDHPYGHGKMENFSATFEGGLVTLAAVLILYEGLVSLLSGHQPRELATGMIVNGVSGALNGLLGWFLIRQGRKHRSAAIEADGHHVVSDFVTTLGMLVGLGVSLLTGWGWVDGLIAILIGILLLRTGFHLVKVSSAALLDQEDEPTLHKLVAALNQFARPEIVAVHELRTLRSGRYVHVDAHIVIPEFLSVSEGHDIVESHCVAVLKAADIEGEFHSHVDPCRQAYCPQCRMPDCKIRRAAPEKTIAPLTVEDATRAGIPENWETI